MVELTINAEMTYRVDLDDGEVSHRWAVAIAEDACVGYPLEGGGHLVVMPQNVTFMEVRPAS